ncbi:hypothetical protein MBLNU457_6414t1 [Dothideomycetes sp. NU457]
MLPPPLKRDPPRLGLSGSRALSRSRAIALPATVTTVQIRDWSWTQHVKRSSYDPDSQYDHLRDRHEQRMRAALRRTLRRRRSWDVPDRVVRLMDSRFASHWAKDSKQSQDSQKEHGKPRDRADNQELSLGEKAMKEAKAMKDYISSLSPWAQAVEDAARSSAEHGRSTSKDQPFSRRVHRPNSHEFSSYKVEAFRRPGQQPVVQGSAISWNSASNEVKRSKYDPISGRMVADNSIVPGSAFLRETSMNNGAIDIPVKKFKHDESTARGSRREESSSQRDVPKKDNEQPARSLRIAPKPVQSAENDVESLTPENVRANMGKSKQQDKPSEQSTSITGLLSKFAAGRPTLQSALDRVNALKGGKLESRASSANDAKIPGAETADQDGYAVKPMGMQTAFAKETTETGSCVRRSLDEEIRTAQNTESHSDGYSTSAQGLQTSFKKEQTSATGDGELSLEEQLKNATSPEVTTDDGYSQSPIGLQRVFEAERLAAAKDKKSSFEQYLKESSDALRKAEIAIEDEYSSSPIGMQTAYENERLAAAKDKRASFEQQLQDATDALRKAELAYDDEYSSSPVGLQNAYEKEREAAMKDNTSSIEYQLKNAEEALHKLEDEYPTSPIGLQTAFKKENEAVLTGKNASFEDQLRAASDTLKAADQALADGYSKSPLGMQRAFEEERKAALLDKRASFEYQLQQAENSLANVQQALDDGYSKSPLGLQKAFEKEREASLLDEKASIEHQLREATDALKNVQEELDDGYSKSPIGLQTTYEKEVEASSVDETASFEQQLKEASESLKQAAKAIDDEYPTTPIGLQKSYEDEVARKESEGSFEQQLREANKDILDAQKGLSGQYEDGYGDSHIGLETSYAAEREAIVKGEKEPLDKELADADKPSKAYTDHYNASPVGLQMIYEQERESSEKGEKPSLEDELAAKRSKAAGDMLRSEIENQKLAMHAHEGRYKHMIPSLVQRSSDATSKATPVPVKIMQGEGDVCHNVADFINNDKWYKQTNGDRQAMMAEPKQGNKEQASETAGVIELEQEMAMIKKSYGEQMEKKSRQVSDLVKQIQVALDKRDKLNDKNVAWRGGRIKEVLEKEYAACEIDIMKLELQIKDARAAQDQLMDKSIKLEKALRSKILQAKMTSATPVRVLRDEARAVKEKKDDLAAAINDVCKDNKLYDVESTRSNSVRAPQPAVASSKQPLPENDIGSKDPTTKQKSTNSVPGSIKVQWAEPKMYKILAYDSAEDMVKTVTMPSSFAENEAPMGIDSVLQRLDDPARFLSHLAKLQSEGYQAVLTMKNLVVLRKVAEPLTAPVEKPTSMAFEEPSTKEPDTRSDINPVDGTARPAFSIPTGNFASPTGFVNYDPVVTPEELASYRKQSSSTSSQPSSQNPDIETEKQTQRVRRQEPVFSGSDRYYYRSEKGYRKERRRAWRRRVRFALAVGGTSAAMVYALGVGAEVARGERKKREG